MGIAVMTLLFLVLLPFVLVVALYTFFTIYAMTKGTAFSSSSINLALFFTGLVVATAALGLVLMGAIAMVGRSLAPAKRRRGEHRV
jgi:hypothetical protein